QSADGACVLSWRGRSVRARHRNGRRSDAARVIAAIRPEDITLSAEKPAHDGNAVRGIIRERIFRGSEVRFVMEVEGADIVVAARQHNAPDGGEALWMSWHPDRTLVVDARPDARPN